MPDQTKASPAETYRFKFDINNYGLREFTHLRLFNGYNKVVSEGYGNMDIQLPRGLYQLRIEMNEHVEDKIYRLTRDTADSISAFNITSAIPTNGFMSTHEYFSLPSEEWSRKST